MSEPKPYWKPIDRVITHVSLRAAVVKGQLHPDDVATLRLLGRVAGYITSEQHERVRATIYQTIDRFAAAVAGER